MDLSQEHVQVIVVFFKGKRVFVKEEGGGLVGGNMHPWASPEESAKSWVLDVTHRTHVDMRRRREPIYDDRMSCRVSYWVFFSCDVPESGLRELKENEILWRYVGDLFHKNGVDFLQLSRAWNEGIPVVEHSLCSISCHPLWRKIFAFGGRYADVYLRFFCIPDEGYLVVGQRQLLGLRVVCRNEKFIYDLLSALDVFVLMEDGIRHARGKVKRKGGKSDSAIWMLGGTPGCTGWQFFDRRGYGDEKWGDVPQKVLKKMRTTFVPPKTRIRTMTYIEEIRPNPEYDEEASRRQGLCPLYGLLPLRHVKDY